MTGRYSLIFLIARGLLYSPIKTSRKWWLTETFEQSNTVILSFEDLKSSALCYWTELNVYKENFKKYSNLIFTVNDVSNYWFSYAIFRYNTVFSSSTFYFINDFYFLLEIQDYPFFLFSD